MRLVTPSRSARRRVTLGAAVPILAAGIALAAPAHSALAVTGSLPATTSFYINPASSVEQWIAANPSNPSEPVIAKSIASWSQASWYTTYNPTAIQSQVSAVTSAAAAKGQVPILVAYEIPDRDCGGASAGGAPDIADYETWISNFAAGWAAAP